MQPEGGAIGEGSSPWSIMRSFSLNGSAMGVADNKARV